MTDLDHRAKLAQLIAALTVEAERLEGLAQENINRSSYALAALNEYGAGETCGKAYTQTQHAERLREIIEEAGK